MLRAIYVHEQVKRPLAHTRIKSSSFGKTKNAIEGWYMTGGIAHETILQFFLMLLKVPPFFLKKTQQEPFFKNV